MSAMQQEIMTAETARAAPPAAPQSEGGALLSMIERLAQNPNIDPDRIERFLVMAREQRAEQARVGYLAALAACQAEMPRVLRDARNTHNQSQYARLESIAKATAPIIAKHGFSLSFSTEASPIQGYIRIVCTCAHRDGHERDKHMDLPPDTAGAQGKANKTPIQGIGSTITYARRYLVLQVFNIALTNDPHDTDGAPAASAGGDDVVSDEQADQLRQALTRLKIRPDEFLRFFRVESVADLPATKFDEAMDEIVRVAEHRARQKPEGR